MANRLTVALDAHRFARGEPERLVLLIRYHLWYPTQIQVLWPSSQVLKGGGGAFAPFDSFLHTGFLDFPPRYRNLHGDGLDEAVATGVNTLLYRLQVVTASPVEWYLSAELPRRFGPPAQTAGGLLDGQEAPLYWGLDLFRGGFPLLEDPGASRPLRILPKEGAFRLLPGYRLARGGDRPLPSPAEIRALGAQLKALYARRGERRWSSLLKGARRCPEGLPFPCDWMGTFFEAHALKGLGGPPPPGRSPGAKRARRGAGSRLHLPTPRGEHLSFRGLPGGGEVVGGLPSSGGGPEPGGADGGLGSLPEGVRPPAGGGEGGGPPAPPGEGHP
jgi:hypothetical protein